MVKNLFMSYSSFFSVCYWKQPEASAFQKKDRQEGGRILVRLTPSFPDRGGIPVSRYTLRPGFVGKEPAEARARRSSKRYHRRRR